MDKKKLVKPLVLTASAVAGLLGGLALAPKFDVIAGTTDAGSVTGGQGIFDPGEAVVDKGKLDQALGGEGGGGAGSQAVVQAIIGLQQTMETLKTELTSKGDQTVAAVNNIGTDVVTAMDKVGGG